MFNVSASPNMNCSTEVECVPQSSTWGLGWVFIPFLAVVLNSFFILVTYRSKNTLRHNYVYAYVISVFAGNFFLGLFTIYSLLNFALIIERYWGTPFPFNVDHLNPSQSRPLQLWWSFRRAFMVSLYLINNANVSALIYGIKDSAYFVGRNASPVKMKTEKTGSSLRHRRNKAVVVIALAWLVPLGFTVAGLFENCIDHCLCVYANYDAVDYCQTGCNSQCSRIWQPLTDKFLLALALMWCAEIVFIVIMLVSAIKRSIQVTKPRIEHQVDEPANDQDQIDAATALSTSVITSPRSVGNQSPVSNLHNITRLNKQTCSRYFENPTVKLLTVISVTFFVTSLPLMVVIFIDVFSAEYVLLRYSVTAVIAISLLYGLLVPVILVRYMSNLRSATESWFLSFKCCTKTTVRKNSLKTVS